jgi:iron-sulfur cluster assembly accessory protein
MSYIFAIRKPLNKRFLQFLLYLHVQIFYDMETVLSAPVSFTEGAITEIKRLMNEPDMEGKKLRVGVKGGGCSGMSYVLGFDKQIEGDEEFEYEGVPCIMNKTHEIYLYGMQIDWEDGLNSRGFTFNNPSASTTCGCGSSFGV